MVVEQTHETIESRRWLSLPLLVAATIGLVIIGANIGVWWSAPLIAEPYVDRLVKYQLVTLGMTALVLLVVFVLGPRHFRRYFRVGELSAPVEPVPWLALNRSGEETWRQAGLSFAIIISVVTSVFMYFSAFRGQTIALENMVYLALVPLLAASNALVEEMLTRFGVVASLDDLVSRHLIYVASAVLFGGVHYFGTPGGVPGVLLAGFLGWLLAKSVFETRGMGWAWFIHFLQDVIIFTGLFWLNL